MNNESKVYTILEQYFILMDNSPVGKNSVFLNNREKERHETILMYAFRKHQAASYHFENVKHMLDIEYSDTMSNDILGKDTTPKSAMAKVSVRKSADKFIYELAAFFETAKSSVDFLSNACCIYLKGIKTDSIRTFIRCVDKNSENTPIFNIVKRHLSWLHQMREYRHHLVHRMVITTSTGQEIHKLGNIVKHINHPVVVPNSTPSYYPDTRRLRMMEDEPTGLNHSYSGGKIKYPDGTEEVIEFSMEYKPAKGYAEISEFMKSHLDTLEDFFFDIINEMKSFNFKKNWA